MKPWKEGRRWEEPDSYYVQSDESEICPFCGCTDIYSGATAYETCTQCNAGWMLGLWQLEK